MPLFARIGIWSFLAYLYAVSRLTVALPASWHIGTKALDINGEGILGKTVPEESADVGRRIPAMRREPVGGAQTDAQSRQVRTGREGVELEKDAVIMPNPVKKSLTSVAQKASGAAPQYILWAPYVKPTVKTTEIVGEVSKGGGVMSGIIAKAATPVAGVIDKVAAVANNLVDALNPMNKFCLTLNSEVKGMQIQIRKCAKASSLASQFVLPGPGETGPIKSKGSGEKCLGVQDHWWGSDDGNFTPGALEITSCKGHVSEHNNSFVMPPLVNGTMNGLIAWSTHPSMCIDVMDHPLKEKKITEKGHDDGLLQYAQGSEPEVVEDEEENIREFEGNIVTLNKCAHMGNWTLLASLLPGAG